MKKGICLPLKSLRALVLALVSMACLGGDSFFLPFMAQLSGTNELPQEFDLYDTLPVESSKGTILDATNPMEFLNRLRRATAMDNATSPSDAIDEAIKALEANEVTE